MLKKLRTIKLYGFGSLLLALNFAFLPPTVNIDSKIRAIINPSIQIVADKTERPAAETASPVTIEPKRVIYVTITAYSSTPDQTDDTPFHTANGTYVRDGIIAANFLKFGTKARFPDYFGNRIFEVQDRMNARYPNRVDIWMPTRQAAMNFGIRQLKMEIY